jgi:tetratricopeptide (TPR) repeat protein
MPRAAYAYSRVLDFAPQNKEAVDFFRENPSLGTQASAVDKSQTIKSRSLSNIRDHSFENEQGSRVSQSSQPNMFLDPQKRAKLAAFELRAAEAYEENGLFSDAAAAFRRSFDWHPSRAAALGEARAHHLNHNSQESIRLVRGHLRSFPDWIDGRLLLARVLFEMGIRHEAQREWQLVLRQDTTNKEALDSLRYSLF